MKNKYTLTKEYAKVYINSKKYGLKTMLLDLDDFERIHKITGDLSIYLSTYPTNTYAVYEKNNRSNSIHREIMNTPKGMHTDHINGNGLDNRKRNLRVVTRVVNNQNRKLSKNNLSKTNGVFWNKLAKKWNVEISVEGKSKYIGVFDTLQDAIKVRKLIEYFYWEYLPSRLQPEIQEEVKEIFNEK